MNKVSFFSRFLIAIAVMFLVPTMAFADDESDDAYLSGKSNTAAGLFEIQATNDLFYFQGRHYRVYSVVYDNPDMNIKIAVNMEGDCNSFVAIGDEFMFFYNCNKDGFGVRKAMFSNPWAASAYDAQRFHDQSVLLKSKRIDKKQALGLIAAYVPELRG